MVEYNIQFSTLDEAACEWLVIFVTSCLGKTICTSQPVGYRILSIERG